MPYLIAFLIAVFSEIAVSANEFKEVFPVQSHTTETVLQLTQEEQKWLARHKSIRIAYDGSLPPYSFINDQGKVDGIAVEIITILGQRLGINFTIYPHSEWSSLYKTAAKRKVDMVATMVSRPDRAEWFIFTKPYLTKSLVIVTKQDNTTINNRSDLADKKISVTKGYQYGEEVGHEFPNSKQLKFETMLESLHAVDKGQVDAAILFLGTANYLQAKHQLTQLKIAAFYERNNANESIAVRKDWPQLLAILQKGLDSLTEKEVQKIFAKWVVQGGIVSTTETSAEKAQPEVPPVIKKIVEPVRKLPIVTSQKPTAEVPKVSYETSERVIPFLIAAALFALWFSLWRKQNAKTGVSISNGNSQLSRNDAKQLAVGHTLEIGDEKPKSGPQTQRPILLNIEQLGMVNELHPELAEETVRYQRDSEGRFSYISPAITSILGYSQADFMENYRHYLTDNPANLHWDGLIEACIEGKPNENYELEVYDSGQAIHLLEVSDSPVYDGQGHCIGVEGMMRDITALRLYNKLSATSSSESKEFAGASHQESLQDHLQLAISTATKKQTAFAFIFLSLERLRFLDGSLISASDDEVFIEANKRLRAALRDTDIVAVLEANKFALIFPETDANTARLVVAKIKNILQVPYIVGVQSIVLDAKSGMAVYPGHGLDPETLISKAQDVLATSLSDSTSEITALKIPIDYGAEGSLRLQQDLVLALDECKVALRALSPNNINALHRHSQFSVYYQSRHNLEDYAITGFEALIRWQHPEFGLLLPKDFVHLVQDIGLLDVMTYWIIQQVSFQAMVWEKKKIRPKQMAINLSDLVGNQAVEVTKITNIMKETGAKFEWFAFSIAESEIANNQDLLVPIITQFVAAGFTVAIDNFGSDGSLLAQLKTIPAQTVEIDPAFIRHLPSDAADADIIAYSIAMLHDLGKTVIAKGVETEQQLEFLKTNGCDMVQGHFLSRPLPPKEAKMLLETLPEFT
jgi:PAS domain S-box-containing protein/diguanylate cyclase (GGDEF)-like protein